ncbi:MAG TPA: PadR family transcriptional regulator [Actinocatenispora sp.]
MFDPRQPGPFPPAAHPHAGGAPFGLGHPGVPGHPHPPEPPHPPGHHPPHPHGGPGHADFPHGPGHAEFPHGPGHGDFPHGPGHGETPSPHGPGHGEAPFPFGADDWDGAGSGEWRGADAGPGHPPVPPGPPGPPPPPFGPPHRPPFPPMGPPFGGPPFGGPGGLHRGPRVRRGDVRAAILALLAEQPRNGYQLIQEIGRRSGGVWRPSPGSVYPALAQLEDEDLVRDKGTGNRRDFELTDAGRQYVEEHPDELAAPWANAAETVSDEPTELWQSLSAVHAAAVQVAQAGTSGQAAAARRILDTARRDIYRILADDPAGEE